MEFHIRIRSFREMQDFVALATAQPFAVRLGNDHQSVNATSFMGVASLDHRRPMRVSAECDEGLFLAFRQKAARFFAE